MSVPIVRQIWWAAVIPQVAFVIAFVWVASIMSPEHGAFLAAASFLALTLVLRRTIARHHRVGISLMKRGHYSEAVDKFQKSLEFFERHPWVDKFRAIVLFSASAMTYREMALVNIAFAYSQSGDGEKARRFYELCVREFPDNGIAVAALRLMDSVNRTAQSTLDGHA